MAYGSLGTRGFTPLGKMAQAMSAPPQGLTGLPPTVTPTPAPPPDVEAPQGRSGLVEAMGDPLRLSERGSNSRGSELSAAMTGRYNGGQSDFIASEPGMFGVMGLSSGTAFDRQGRGYDTTNLDVGALAGGLIGGLAGPIGGLAGGLAGRQADANVVLDATRNPGLFTAGQRSGMQLSRGEGRAQQEARDWWSQRNPAATAFQAAQPATPRGSPQLERLLSQAKAQRSEAGSQTQYSSPSKSAAASGQTRSVNESKRGK